MTAEVFLMIIDVVVKLNPADMTGDLNNLEAGDLDDLEIGESSNRIVGIAGDNSKAEPSVD